jgi:uncharacterized protein (TIGR03435 family)
MFKPVFLSITAGLLLAAGTGYGQTAAAPQFEVASVKPAALDMLKLAQTMQTSGEMPKIGKQVNGARAEYIFMGLLELISEAYGVKPTQITGGPDWMKNPLSAPRFDIFAKMPDGAKAEDAPKMLQALLEDRFKLKVHRENKERQVMALVVGKGGSKLEESTEGKDFDENTPLKPGEREIDSPEGKIRIQVDTKNGSSVTNMGKRGTWTQSFDREKGALHYQGSQMTMGAFADMLTGMTQLTGGSGFQIVDQTGLKGNYVVKFDLSLADIMKMVQAMGMAVPDLPAAGAGRGANAAPADAASDPGGSNSSFTSVQALGLDLKPRKAAVDQLIIDHVEKTPIEN